MSGASGGGPEEVACFVETHRDGSGEANIVLDGDSSNENDDSFIGGISNCVRGTWVGNQCGKHYL